jgi:4-hydroxy-tetrahydrodipicolinate synthase
MLKGSLVAIATPFKDDVLDENGLRQNLRFLIRNGSHGIVPCATTGESPSLSDEEYERIIKITVEETAGKLPIIAGAGTNSTAKTIKLMHRAQDFGATALLVVTPYYNKPPAEGLFRHYQAVSAESNLPIVIYNVPGRTGTNILPKTVARLARECKNIVAIKEASGNLEQITELALLRPENFAILSGDDSLTFPMLAIGAQGVISVCANILPREVSQMCERFFAGDIEAARALHLKMFPVMKALFIESNPIPLKKAMELMGMAAGNPRLPLAEMSPDNARLLKEKLVEYGIKL